MNGKTGKEEPYKLWFKEKFGYDIDECFDFDDEARHELAVDLLEEEIDAFDSGNDSLADTVNDAIMYIF